MPWLVRRANAREADARAHCASAADGPRWSPSSNVPKTRPGRCTRGSPTRIEWLNVNVGVFVAYWCRDLGFRLLLRGDRAFRVQFADELGAREHVSHVRHACTCCREPTPISEDQHVRVDVFYTQFSVRGKAIADIITSVFFFIFMRTMLWTGYKFAADAVSLGECLIHGVGRAILAGEADDADRRGSDGAARHLQAHQGHYDPDKREEREPWASRSTSHG